MDKQKTDKTKNKKVDSGLSGEGRGKSLLNKNDLSLVFLGAGVLTIVVFFVFFSNCGDKDRDAPVNTQQTSALENRIAKLEEILDNKGLEPEEMPGTENSHSLLASCNARLERVEAALSLKYGTITERMDNMEAKVSDLIERMDTMAGKIDSAAALSVKKTEKAEKSRSQTFQEKKKSPKQVLYTVKKGDTLYSISRKFKISLDRLRKMNKLTKTSKIYPGDNLVVR
ncbi:MAG: LysM peptidoglycan-binding domain-containing protein [Thermodesulfobacteriota bacterium]|nr:LysM peptidoglycan-binding domain-containing protein [Thermodesulfobacteriota bacterium]